jgi:hypothetical protein
MKLTIKTREDIVAEALAQQSLHQRSEAQSYLLRTDWLVVRRAETSLPIPEDILLARAAARKVLSS